MKTACINDEHLTDYLEGRLSLKHRRKIETHLADCEHCIEDIEVYQNVMSISSNDKLSIVPPDSVKRIIKRLDYVEKGNLIDEITIRIKSLSFQWQRFLAIKGLTGSPTLEPIRGNKTIISDDLVILNKSFSDLETEISIEKIDNKLANVSVSISKVNPEKIPIRVSLISEKREVASYLMGTGEETFESLQFGHYILSFSYNSVLIGKYSFHLRESGNGSKDTVR